MPMMHVVGAPEPALPPSLPKAIPSLFPWASPPPPLLLPLPASELVPVFDELPHPKMESTIQSETPKALRRTICALVGMTSFCSAWLSVSNERRAQWDSRA